MPTDVHFFELLDLEWSETWKKVLKNFFVGLGRNLSNIDKYLLYKNKKKFIILKLYFF